MPNRNWMDAVAVSEEFPIKRSTLYYFRSVGGGPKSYRIGKKLVYKRADVEAWVELQASEPQAAS